MTRWAAADLGTNTFRLLVAEERKPGELSLLRLDQKVVRLGQGLRTGGDLATAAVERSVRLLDAFAATLDELEVSRRVATLAAVGRSARDAPAFAALAGRRLDADVRILPGDEEARLSAQGAWSLVEPATARAIFVDIGGGSTEVAGLEKGIVQAAESLPVGVVKLHEAVQPGDPPTPQDGARIESQARASLAALPAALRPQRWQEDFLQGKATLLATAGTPLTVAAYLSRLPISDTRALNGIRVSHGALQSVWEQFVGMTLADRARLPSVETGREDVILAGVALLKELVRVYAAPEVVVCDGGLAEGVLLDAVRRARGRAAWEGSSR